MGEMYIAGLYYHEPYERYNDAEDRRRAMQRTTVNDRPATPPPMARPDQHRVSAAEIERHFRNKKFPFPYWLLFFFNLAAFCMTAITASYLAFRAIAYRRIDNVALVATLGFYAVPRWIVNPIWIGHLKAKIRASRG